MYLQFLWVNEWSYTLLTLYVIEHTISKYIVIECMECMYTLCDWIDTQFRVYCVKYNGYTSSSQQKDVSK